MEAATLDLAEILKGIPEGAWVAVSEKDQRVIAYSADLQAVVHRASEEGEQSPLIVRVPERPSILFL
jgi:hypothetical protein